MKSLPQRPPRDLVVTVSGGDSTLQLVENEEGLIAGYYARLYRAPRRRQTAVCEIAGLARPDEVITSDILAESSTLFFTGGNMRLSG
jgi:hypothetical protein